VVHSCGGVSHTDVAVSACEKFRRGADNYFDVLLMSFPSCGEYSSFAAAAGPGKDGPAPRRGVLALAQFRTQ
jgi:hypothetical protein